MKKRALSLLLALALLLTLLPRAAQTVRAEDIEEIPAAADRAETKAGDKEAQLRRAYSPEELAQGREDAVELRLDEELAVVIAEPGEHAWLRFTPALTGRYVLTSYADSKDTCCSLYDSANQHMAWVDHGGEGENFRLRYWMEAGETYYFEVFYYLETETGSFPVMLTAIEPASSGRCGNQLNWSFDESTGLLAIEGEGNMWDFDADPGCEEGFEIPWLAYCSEITAVSLPEGLGSIGDCAFRGCSALRELTIPQGVSRIGFCAFEGCSALEQAELPDSLTSLKSYAFSGCAALSEITIPANTTEVRESAFAYCTSLRSVTFLNPICRIPDELFGEYYGVTIYGYDNSSAQAFAEEYGRFFVSIGSAALGGPCGDTLSWRYDPANQTLIIEGSGEMWDFRYYDDSVDKPDIPWEFLHGWVRQLSLPEGLRSIGEYAFIGFAELRGIAFPESVTEIHFHAFSGCKRLSSVVLPEHLEYLSGFASCYNLLSVTIPDTVTVFGPKAFCSCGRLQEIHIPDGVTSIGAAAFRDCTGLTAAELPEGLTQIDREAFGRCTGLKEMTIPASAEYLGSCAFEGCTALRSLTVLSPACVIDYGCLADTNEMTIYGYTDSTAETLAAEYGYPFVSLGAAALGGRCGQNLTWTYDPETGALTIGGEGNMWQFGWPEEEDEDYHVRPWTPYMDQIKTVTVEEGATSIGGGAFMDCAALTRVEISGSVQKIGSYAFGLCAGLEELVLREGLRSIGMGAFWNCSSLTELQLPRSLESLNGFIGCEGLRSVAIPDKVSCIGEDAFLGCNSLRSVTIPESVRVIETGAFMYCPLRSVVLPSGLQSIGENAFASCEELWQLVLRNPDCMVCAYSRFGPGDGAYEREEEYDGSLGVPGQTVIYGYHDAENENAEMMLVNQDSEDWHRVTGWRYMENYAKVCGYTFRNLGAFSDVSPKSYYELPVAWAVAMGITSGTGEGQFSPKKTCTREQIVSFLWKAAGSPAPESTESPFADVTPGKYYYKAVLWAVENNITGGVGEGKFGVGRPCTREQAMSFLWKAVGSPEPESTESPFTDVQPGKYYYKAVLWAVENGVTGGVSAERFGVGQSCTRAQIVTFLYKVYN